MTKISAKQPRSYKLFRLIGPLVLLGIGTGARMLFRKRERHQQSDDAPDRTARHHFDDYDVSGRTVTIARPRQELYSFWRDFDNLAAFMENVVSVQRSGANGRAVWTIKAPAGQQVEIETEIIREDEGNLIAWRSEPGSEIDTEGCVIFKDAPGERGTQVTAIISYKPPGGVIGKAVAKLFLREPAIQARHDLKRFKMLMEAGEIATSARRKEDSRAAQQTEQWHEKEEA